jgi:hypothetical protein
MSSGYYSIVAQTRIIQTILAELHCTLRRSKVATTSSSYYSITV